MLVAEILEKVLINVRDVENHPSKLKLQMGIRTKLAS
jgi:hypothetical protein